MISDRRTEHRRPTKPTPILPTQPNRYSVLASPTSSPPLQLATIQPATIQPATTQTTIVQPAPVQPPPRGRGMRMRARNARLQMNGRGVSGVHFLAGLLESSAPALINLESGGEEESTQPNSSSSSSYGFDLFTPSNASSVSRQDSLDTNSSTDSRLAITCDPRLCKLNLIEK